MRIPFIGAALAAALALATPALADVRLTGSGASFPFPLYSAWFKDFSGKTEGVTVDYQSKGSGAGIQDFINKVVDFAASDAAMRSVVHTMPVSNCVVFSGAVRNALRLSTLSLPAETSSQ